MVNYDIKDVQHHTLRILLALDEVCRQHQLSYYLWAGTMLGAVRHKGFIPWDDDADVAMPREDYERLIAHPEWLPAPFELVCTENDATYPLPFGKIQAADTTLIERAHLRYLGGLYIDVFPLDGVPSCPLRRRLHFARYEWLKKLLYFVCRDPYKHGHGPQSWVPLWVQRHYTLQGIQQRIVNLLKRFPYRESNLVADYDDGMRGILPKEVLGTPTDCLFEGHTLKGVEQYHRYLSAKYGEYMVIPKEGNRHQHHFHYVDFHTPYRDYREPGN